MKIKDTNGNVLYESVKSSGKATLEEAVAAGVDLTLAYLSEADLRGADLRGAYLYKANLRRALLEGANFIGADIEGAIGIPGPFDWWPKD